MQLRSARGNALNVPVGTDRHTRSVLSVTARRFSVARGPDLLFGATEGAKWFVSFNVPSGTLCPDRGWPTGAYVGVRSGEERTFRRNVPVGTLLSLMFQRCVPIGTLGLLLGDCGLFQLLVPLLWCQGA